MLRDTENHDGRGVHDADDGPGEPDGSIGEVSPIIGKVPATPGRFALHTGLARARARSRRPDGIRSWATSAGPPTRRQVRQRAST
jgi:hypothetical protein